MPGLSHRSETFEGLCPGQGDIWNGRVRVEEPVLQSFLFLPTHPPPRVWGLLFCPRCVGIHLEGIAILSHTGGNDGCRKGRGHGFVAHSPHSCALDFPVMSPGVLPTALRGRCCLRFTDEALGLRGVQPVSQYHEAVSGEAEIGTQAV